jgi:hypothetical protein
MNHNSAYTDRFKNNETNFLATLSRTCTACGAQYKRFASKWSYSKIVPHSSIAHFAEQVWVSDDCEEAQEEIRVLKAAGWL